RHDHPWRRRVESVAAGLPWRRFDGAANHDSQTLMTAETRLLRADLHVHSFHSGYAPHFRFLRSRDCYSEPDAVYRVAKARGMDLVTITDHDRIGGCLEFLERHPGADDFFISEEIESWFPDLPLKVHIGAYGITERI